MKSIISRLFASDLPRGSTFYFWHEPGKSAQDKKLLYKIDATILIYGCLSYWIKYLDSANLSNAYVTGLKTDLHLFANQYTLMVTLFTVGTAISQIPSNLLLTKIPPRIWLPGCEFVWGLCTLLTYRVTSAKQLYALRFMIGLLEGTCFVGMQYVLGSWYTRFELGKRTAIFASCAYAGTLFSGLMQSGIQKHLNGNLGLAGWRWLFIIDAILTFAVAIFGLIFFPDTPATTTAWYLTPDEKLRAVERLREDGKIEERSSINLDLFKRVIFDWKFALLIPVWIGWSNTVGKYIGTVFPLWMQTDQKTAKNPNGRWTVYQINNIPTSVTGSNILSMLFTAWLIDWTGRRLAVIYVCLLIQIMGTAILIAYNVNLGAHIFGFLTAANDGPTSPIVMTYANILLSGDAQQRALTIACMNTFGSAVSSIVNKFGYYALSAPKFHKGLVISLCAVFLELVGVTLLRYKEITRVKPVLEARLAEIKQEKGLESEEEYDEKKPQGVVAVLPEAGNGV